MVYKLQTPPPQSWPWLVVDMCIAVFMAVFIHFGGSKTVL